MNDKQPVILVVGVGLIVANLWLGGQFTAIADVIVNGQVVNNQTVLKDTGLEIGLLFVLILFAGLSDTAGTVILWFLAALWLVFLFNHVKQL